MDHTPDSPEAVAFALMMLIVKREETYCTRLANEIAGRSRGYILDLFGECLRIVQGDGDRPRCH